MIAISLRKFSRTLQSLICSKLSYRFEMWSKNVGTYSWTGLFFGFSLVVGFVFELYRKNYLNYLLKFAIMISRVSL